jgi:hypothetical protein
LSVPDKDSEAMVMLALALGGGIQLLGQLLDRIEADGTLDDDQRRAALEGARRIALVARLCFVRIEELERNLPEPHQHHAALRSAGRVAYALVAMAGEEPEELALLSRGELDGLLRENEIEGWMDAWLARAPR